MILDAILDSYLVQVVYKPTRGDNILDLILTSNEALVENINIEEPFASSDHCVVKFDITCNIIRKDWKLCYYDYRHGNYEDMKVYLAEMDWSSVINCYDVIEVWSRFVKMMKDLHGCEICSKKDEEDSQETDVVEQAHPESGEEENEKFG